MNATGDLEERSMHGSCSYTPDPPPPYLPSSSMNATGDLEERSMHGACPVLKGEKWSMTKWM